MKALAFASQKLQAQILVSTYDPTANIVMDDITINKTLSIRDSVKKIIYAASTDEFAVNIVTVINIAINKTFGIQATIFLTERMWILSMF